MPSIKEIPDTRETPEAKEMGTTVHVNKKTVGLANGATDTNERQPAGKDEFYLSPASRAKYGILDSEDIAWGLNTADNTPWAQHCTIDRIEEITDDNPGARVIMNPDTGRPVRRRDLFLVARPKEGVAQRDARDLQAALEHNRSILESDNEGNIEGADERERRRIRDTTSRSLREGGFIGPTQGMSMQEAVRGKSREEIEDELTFMRSAGRFSSAAEEKAARAGAKTFGGLGGNPSHNKWETTKDKQRAAAASR